MTTAEDRITALEAAVEALVDQLQNAPALAAAPSPPPPAPPPPERWAAPADTAGWTELMDWVDGLTADYSCSAAGVPGLSIGRCNKGSGGLGEQPVQCLSGGLQLEGGTGPFVQGVLDACEVGGGVQGEVAAFGEPMP